MQCPTCRATIPDRSEICPRCDAILDASFLGEEFRAGSRPPAPRAPRPAVSARPAAPAPHPPATAGMPAPAQFPPPPVGAPPPAAAPPLAPAPAPVAPADPEVVAQREVGTRIVQLDPQRDQGTRIVQAPALPPELKERQAESRGRTRRAARDDKGADGKAASGDPPPKRRLELALEESAVSRDLDAVLDRVKYTFTKLDKIDRLLFYTLTATFVATLLPWIYVPGQGLLSGIQDVFGALAAGAGAVALGAFATRAWRRLRGGYLLLFELAGTFGVAAASTYRALTLTGSPYVGLYLSVIAAGAAFLLGLVRLVR